MIFRPRTDEALYRFYSRKYGPPQITAWGEAVWAQVAEKFVRDATGKILIRTREVKLLGKSGEGLYIYLGPKSRIKDGTKVVPSFVL